MLFCYSKVIAQNDRKSVKILKILATRSVELVHQLKQENPNHILSATEILYLTLSLVKVEDLPNLTDTMRIVLNDLTMPEVVSQYRDSELNILYSIVSEY